MAACILRVYGIDFDPDGFVRDCTLTPSKLWRKGEPHGWKHQIATESGINFVVSNGSDVSLEGETRGAVEFLKANRAEIARLRRFPGVERAVLDFALHRRDVLAQYDEFPESLVGIAGELGLSIVLSQYLATEDPDVAAR